jgi:hypothetical protein
MAEITSTIDLEAQVAIITDAIGCATCTDTLSYYDRKATEAGGSITIDDSDMLEFIKITAGHYAMSENFPAEIKYDVVSQEDGDKILYGDLSHEEWVCRDYASTAVLGIEYLIAVKHFSDSLKTWEVYRLAEHPERPGDKIWTEIAHGV